MGINTKFVGHHVSSGGYIFCRDSDEKDYVVLIKNRKGEYWIPKGHIEQAEDHLSSAFREINEEVGIESADLRFICLSEVYKFEYMDRNNLKNTKEVYMNIFEVTEKLRLLPEERGDVVSAEWFECESAVDAIMHYSQESFQKAWQKFKESKLK